MIKMKWRFNIFSHFFHNYGLITGKPSYYLKTNKGLNRKGIVTEFFMVLDDSYWLFLVLDDTCWFFLVLDVCSLWFFMVLDSSR